MRNAKLLLLAGVSVLCAVGCTIETHTRVKEVSYDFSDYAYYDKPFATSPNYREANPSAVEAPVAIARATPSVLPAKADLTPTNVNRYGEATAEPAGVQASRPRKATAFATHAASVLSGEASK